MTHSFPPRFTSPTRLLVGGGCVLLLALVVLLVVSGDGPVPLDGATTDAVGPPAPRSASAAGAAPAPGTPGTGAPGRLDAAETGSDAAGTSAAGRGRVVLVRPERLDDERLEVSAAPSDADGGEGGVRVVFAEGAPGAETLLPPGRWRLTTPGWQAIPEVVEVVAGAETVVRLWPRTTLTVRVLERDEPLAGVVAHLGSGRRNLEPDWSATRETDAKGGFQVEPPYGRADALLRTPDGRWAFTRIAESDRDEDGEVVVDVATPLAPSRVTVTDAASGVPVVGARFYARSAVDVPLATTDGGGVALLPRRSRELAELLVVADGYERTAVSIRSDGDATVRLKRRRRLELVVRGPNGDPLEGAVVAALPPREEWRPWGPRRWFEATSDRDGRVFLEFPEEADDAWLLAAHHASGAWGVRPMPALGGGLEWRLETEPPLVLPCGEVLDPSRPLRVTDGAGRTITVTAKDGRFTVADPFGAVRLSAPHADGGTVELHRARSCDSAWAFARDDTTRSATTGTLVLSDDRSRHDVRVRVVKPNGDPAVARLVVVKQTEAVREAARLWPDLNGGMPTSRPGWVEDARVEQGPVATDRDGFVTFHGLVPGTADVLTAGATSTAPGVGGAEARLVVPDDFPATLRLPYSLDLDVTVRSPDGVRPDDLELTLTDGPQPDDTELATYAGKEGRYRHVLPWRPDEHLWLVVEGYRPVDLTPRVRRAAGRDEVVPLRLDLELERVPPMRLRLAAASALEEYRVGVRFYRNQRDLEDGILLTGGYGVHLTKDTTVPIEAPLVPCLVVFEPRDRDHALAPASVPFQPGAEVALTVVPR